MRRASVLFWIFVGCGEPNASEQNELTIGGGDEDPCPYYRPQTIGSGYVSHWTTTDGRDETVSTVVLECGTFFGREAVRSRHDWSHMDAFDSYEARDDGCTVYAHWGRPADDWLLILEKPTDGASFVAVHSYRWSRRQAPVVVPAGTFDDCYHLEGNPGGFESVDVYCRGVGMVMSDSDYATYSEHWELVSRSTGQ